MRVGDRIKLCFVPIGATFRVGDDEWVLVSTSEDFKIGLSPASTSGWYGHTDVLKHLQLRNKKFSNKEGYLPVQMLSCNVHIVELPNTKPEKSKRSSTMERNIAAIMREDAKTVEVNFGGNSSKIYTYVTDLDVAVGDHAIVECGNDGLKVVQIMGVHDDLNIEPNSDIEYKWLVAKFDLEHYKLNQAKNAEIETVMATGYRNNMRRQFAASILAGLSEDKQAELSSIISGQKTLDVKPKARRKSA